MCEDDSDTIVLQHLTKATGRAVIPDPLYHQKTKDIEQTNPIVTDRLSNKTFTDTYNSVCNIGADILPRSSSNNTGIIATHNNNATPLTELQKLCIVQQITRNDNFLYNPENCKFDMYLSVSLLCHVTQAISHHTSLLISFYSSLFTGFNDQPCMTLQTKFFRLVSIVSGQPISSPSDIAVEIDACTYQSGKSGPSPNMFVSAQEVVFDSVGKVTCNRSMYVPSLSVLSC